VACVCENNDWERCKDLNRALDVDNIDVAARGCSVTNREVVDHKNDQIANGNKRNNGSVLQAVEPAQERKGYHNEPGMKSAVPPNFLVVKTLT
jgi:hypothetical protein